jgi:hypothetical protein
MDFVAAPAPKTAPGGRDLDQALVLIRLGAFCNFNLWAAARALIRWRAPSISHTVPLTGAGRLLLAIAGGCLCRAVRFQIKADGPLGARYCWCRVCQYLGAGTGAVSALFRKADITVSGPLIDYVSRADSGATMHRRFCSRCGTQVFSEAEERPDSIFVRAGALDDPDLAAPTATIWSQSAPKWACFDPDLPQVQGQPPPLKV